jgi:hypothetical protein
MTAGFQVRDRGAVVVHLLGECALAPPRLLTTGHQTGAKSTPQLLHTRRFTGHFPHSPLTAHQTVGVVWSSLARRASNLMRHP